MRIIGKAAPVESQLLGRIQGGIREIELHLKDYTFNEDKILEELRKPGVVGELSVYSVHGPMVDETSLSYLHKEEFRDGFKRSISLAEKLSEEYGGRRIGLVMHVPHLKNHKEQEAEIYDIVREAFEGVEKVDLYIENTTALKKSKETNHLEVTSGFLYENVSLCKYMRNRGMSNVYTLLDLCHAEAVEEFYRRFPELTEDSPKVSLGDYIYQNRDTLGAIHVATVEGLGILPGTHGTALTDTRKILELKGYLDKYGLEPLLIIEVGDTDIINTPEACKTYKAVRSVFN